MKLMFHFDAAAITLYGKMCIIVECQDEYVQNKSYMYVTGVCGVTHK